MVKHVIAIAMFAWSSSIHAQNAFPTPAGKLVPGVVLMCLNGSGKAVPCVGTGNNLDTFKTPNGVLANGVVQMCVKAGKAVSC